MADSNLLSLFHSRVAVSPQEQGGGNPVGAEVITGKSPDSIWSLKVESDEHWGGALLKAFNSILVLVEEPLAVLNPKLQNAP